MLFCGILVQTHFQPLSLELIVSEKKRVRRTPNFCEEDLPTQPCCVYQTVVKITVRFSANISII